eukprot:4335931-Pyramimonas_sp.AAC.1
MGSSSELNVLLLNFEIYLFDTHVPQRQQKILQQLTLNYNPTLAARDEAAGRTGPSATPSCWPADAAAAAATCGSTPPCTPSLAAAPHPAPARATLGRPPPPRPA